MGFISLKLSPGTGISSWRSTRSTWFRDSTRFHYGSLANRARWYSTAMYVARWRLRLRMSTNLDACSTVLRALYTSRRGGGCNTVVGAGPRSGGRCGERMVKGDSFQARARLRARSPRSGREGGAARTLKGLCRTHRRLSHCLLNIRVSVEESGLTRGGVVSVIQPSVQGRLRAEADSPIQSSDFGGLICK